jgi:hypothetical protein
MITIIDLDAEDLEGIVVAIAMSNRRSPVTEDPGAADDGTVGMLPSLISIMGRPDRQF